MAKNKNTIIKEETIKKLFNLDSKLKFTNPNWNQKVKEAFNNSGSFNFENLVYTDINSAEKLIRQFN